LGLFAHAQEVVVGPYCDLSLDPGLSFGFRQRFSLGSLHLQPLLIEISLSNGEYDH